MSVERSRPTLSAAILTLDRPVEVRRAVASCALPLVEEVLVFDNGSVEPSELEGARLIRSEENIGPCAARNRLVDLCGSDLVLFLDDDAVLDRSSDLGRVVDLFAADPRLAVVAGVVVRPDGSIAPFEFPRRRVTGVGVEGPVGYFLEGACVVRRSAFVEAGGFDPDFFYGHESADLSLRLAQRGRVVVYSPSLHVEHRPSPTGRNASRHSDARQLVNREVLARRNLPWAIRQIHVMAWRLLYGWRALRSGPRALGRFRHEVATLRRQRSNRPALDHRDRLGYRQSLRLHRIGYRVFW